MLWDPKYRNVKGHVVEYIHRVNDKIIIKKAKLDNVEEIGSWYFVVKLGFDRKIIPFHRIVRIIDNEGNILWSKTYTSNSKPKRLI